MRRTIGWLALSVLPQPVKSAYRDCVALEDVVRAVVQPAEALRRAVLAAFRRVVEHHVENHLDAGAMQRLHHVAELVDRPERILPRAVRLVRREERHRLVAPVVDAPVARRDGLRVELEDGQQLHRGDAQLLQVGNLLDQPGVACRGFARRRPSSGAA